MLKFSPREKQILDELKAGALPEVVAIRLNMEKHTLINYLSRIRKKCFKAARFLREAQDYQDLLKLRIKVSVQEEPKRVVWRETIPNIKSFSNKLP